MNISKKVIPLILLSVIVLVGSSVYINRLNKQSQLSEENFSVGTIAVKNSDELMVLTDSPVYRTFKALAEESDLVVIGEVVKKDNKTRNLAKNPENIQEEAKDRKVMSQEYEFKIERLIKGTEANNIINIVYPEYQELNNDTKTKTPSGKVELVSKQRYALFLKEGIDNTYYGTAEPWQFRINNNKLEMITNVKEFIFEDLENMTEDKLVSLLNK